MSIDQIGVYILLLCKAWHQSPPCSLPNDDEILSRWSRAGNRWSEVKGAVLACFVLREDGRWYQHRLEREWSSLRAERKGKSLGGKASAAKRLGRVFEDTSQDTSKYPRDVLEVRSQKSEKYKNNDDDRARPVDSTAPPPNLQPSNAAAYRPAERREDVDASVRGAAREAALVALTGRETKALRGDVQMRFYRAVSDSLANEPTEIGGVQVYADDLFLAACHYARSEACAGFTYSDMESAIRFVQAIVKRCLELGKWPKDLPPRVPVRESSKSMYDPDEILKRKQAEMKALRERDTAKQNGTHP